MHCPKCRAEFREGFIECEECQLALVALLPALPEPAPESSIWDNGDLVTLLEPGDMLTLTIAKARLDLAGIRYLILGGPMQNLFIGWGAIAEYNDMFGKMQIKVLKADAEAAVAVLKEAEAAAEQMP